MCSRALLSSAPVDPALHWGFRLKRCDDADYNTPSFDSGARPSRSVNISPIVDANVRASRHTRYPFDSADILRPTDYNTNYPLRVVTSGVWTYDFLYDFAASTTDARTYMPFFTLTSAGNVLNRLTVFDVPSRSAGLLSLGQLRHAPTNAFCYGPSMPIGNGRIPIPGGGGGFGAEAMTARTGVAASELTTAWNTINRWTGALATGVREADRIGNATHDIFDIAFEQNLALWDTFRVSGIDTRNPGWSPGADWANDNPATGNLTRVLPDSRFAPTGFAWPQTGYYADANFRLYKASATLLQQGAFNVNSTSKTAWVSLLSAFRGVPVPTGQGAVTQGTPFLRVLYPGAGAVGGSAASDAGHTPEAWAGFRALSDDEIGTLAEKIILEVKKRGPFLGLSDFVNRRLKTPSVSEYADWTTYETDYLGTLEAAINEAGLNNRFDDALPPEQGVRTQRALSDPTSTVYYDYPAKNLSTALKQVPRNPQNRSKHKVAGAPGYLEQGDILQAIGGERSRRDPDTFKIHDPRHGDRRRRHGPCRTHRPTHAPAADSGVVRRRRPPDQPEVRRRCGHRPPARQPAFRPALRRDGIPSTLHGGSLMHIQLKDTVVRAILLLTAAAVLPGAAAAEPTPKDPAKKEHMIRVLYPDPHYLSLAAKEKKDGAKDLLIPLTPGVVSEAVKGSRRLRDRRHASTWATSNASSRAPSWNSIGNPWVKSRCPAKRPR